MRNKWQLNEEQMTEQVNEEHENKIGGRKSGRQTDTKAIIDNMSKQKVIEIDRRAIGEIH